MGYKRFGSKTLDLLSVKMLLHKAHCVGGCLRVLCSAEVVSTGSDSDPVGRVPCPHVWSSYKSAGTRV